jgi:hypothetical protein
MKKYPCFQFIFSDLMPNTQSAAKQNIFEKRNSKWKNIKEKKRNNFHLGIGFGRDQTTSRKLILSNHQKYCRKKKEEEKRKSRPKKSVAVRGRGPSARISWHCCMKRPEGVRKFAVQPD